LLFEGPTTKFSFLVSGQKHLCLAYLSGASGHQRNIVMSEWAAAV